MPNHENIKPEQRELLEWVAAYLMNERYDDANPEALKSMATEHVWNLTRGLLNTRNAEPATDEFLARQDELLRSMIADAGITDAAALAPCAADERIAIWQGDITTLAADAIVNAANQEMTGCWIPNHLCIDNAIHTFAGIQLRAECYQIMKKQGHEEATGEAKVTAAYNLPAKHVIHTVGPIAKGGANILHQALLKQCYLSCLDAAAEAGCKTLAFCCISTGVFGFPQNEAADIAVDAVRGWLDGHDADLHVVFDVFEDTDLQLYQALLGA